MIKAEDILKAVKGKLINGEPGTSIKGFSIDSRTLSKGDLFIAVKGNRFDGHNFISEAVKKGAAGAVISVDSLRSIARSPLVIQVKDTVKALGDIAHYKRMRSESTVIAITGSNGKTTTKDMAASILKTNFKVLKTRGTENNNIGLPLALLKQEDERFCVLEMGTNHFGEIDHLSRVAAPEVAVITNIGPCHLEGLGDIEGVFKAKTELLKYMDKDKTLIINGDDPYLAKISKASSRIVRFGLDEHNDIRATSVKFKKGLSSFSVNGKYEVQLNVLGRHNIYNALAAISVAELFGISKKAIQASLRGFKVPYSRLVFREVNGIKLIDDAYNSNPTSLRSAAEVLANYKVSGRKILVCGDMLELGKMSQYFHEAIADMVKVFGIDILITVGKHSYKTYLAAKNIGMKKDTLWHFEKSNKAGELLKEITGKGDMVLVKGSRGMMMEDVIKCFTTSSIR